MKLHLPKSLLTAVLAVGMALPMVYAEDATGIGNSYDKTYTYAGTVYTFAGNIPGNGTVTEYVKVTTRNDAENPTAWTEGEQQATATSNYWASLYANETTAYNTLRITENKDYYFNFAPLTMGGIIVESGTEDASLYSNNTGSDRSIVIGKNGLTANSYFGDSFTFDNLKGKDNTRFVINGTQTWYVADEETVTIQTKNAITNNADWTINGGNLNINKTINNAGTITLTDSTLSLTIDNLFNLTNSGVTYSNGTDGFITGGTFTIINNTADSSSVAGAANVTIGNGTYQTTTSDGDITLQITEKETGLGYYVASTTEYSAGSEVASVDNVILKGGTLNLNTNLKDGAIIGTMANNGGTVNMGAATTLAQSSVQNSGNKITLNSADATAMYTVTGGNNTELNVTLGSDWTGTVKLSDMTMTNLDLNSYANDDKSSILFDGVTGYSKKGENTFNMILADGKDALIFDNGSNNDGHTFTGKVSGSGNIVRQTDRGSHQYYKFTGDVSEWTGAFIGKNTVAAQETTIRFTDDATTVAASVKQTGAATTNVIVANGEDVSMTGELTATAGKLTITKKKTEDDNGAETGDGSKLAINTVSANGGNVELNTTEGNTMAVTNLSVKSGNTITGSADLTVTNLTLGSTEAINLTGSLTLADGATINLTGLTLTEGTTTYTLATAANGVSLQDYTLTGLDLSGTAFADYTATISAVNPNATAGIMTLAEGSTTTALVLTLTANQPETPETLTSLTINGGSYDAATGVLTFTTLENATDAVFGDTLNATMSEDVWAAIVGATTLPDEVLVSFEGADGELFDFNNGATVPTITINGEGTKGAQVLEGDGTIVGGYVTSYIPEPTTTTLSLLALAGLAVRRRRK